MSNLRAPGSREFFSVTGQPKLNGLHKLPATRFILIRVRTIRTATRRFGNWIQDIFDEVSTP